MSDKDRANMERRCAVAYNDIGARMPHLGEMEKRRLAVKLAAARATCADAGLPESVAVKLFLHGDDLLRYFEEADSHGGDAREDPITPFRILANGVAKPPERKH